MPLDLLIQAHTVLPVSAPPIADGAVVVAGSRIVAVGAARQLRLRYRQARTVHLPSAVLLPGFVNAHTHLELSALRGKTAYRGDFADWLGQVVAGRAAAGDLGEAIAAACEESVAAGVTTVADIAAGHVAWPHLVKHPIRKVCFAEAISIGRTSAEITDYLHRSAVLERPDELTSFGLTPHAPYTTLPDVYELSARLAQRHDLPLTTHLAETPDEDELLRHGRGPLLDLVQAHFNNGRRFRCPHLSPLEYLLSLDLAERPALLAHVNYADPADLARLAASRHSVAFCPRSHAFFRHGEHAWVRMLELGINVCLGTDSLASNSSLSILDELRFLRQRRGDIPAAMLLEMATLNGARALGLEGQIGSLRPGGYADLTAIPCDVSAGDVTEDILRGGREAVLTMVHGRIVHDAC